MRAVYVGCLHEPAAPQKRFEESWRLVDPELHVGDVAVLDLDAHSAFTLDAGEVVGLDRLRPLRHFRALSKSRTLKVRNTRSIERASIPSTFSRFVMATVFGDSIGPKHP